MESHDLEEDGEIREEGRSHGHRYEDKQDDDEFRLVKFLLLM